MRTPEKRTAISVEPIEDSVTSILNGADLDDYGNDKSEMEQLASFRFGDGLRFMGGKLLFGNSKSEEKPQLLPVHEDSSMSSMSFLQPVLSENLSEASVHEGSSFIIDSSERLGGINNSTVLSMGSKDTSSMLNMSRTSHQYSLQKRAKTGQSTSISMLNDSMALDTTFGDATATFKEAKHEKSGETETA